MSEQQETVAIGDSRAWVELAPESATSIHVVGGQEARQAFWSAFAQAQANFEAIHRDREGQKGNQRFQYATLSSILRATVPHLAASGIAFQQHANSDGGTTTTITTILAGHGCEVWSSLSFERSPWGAEGKYGEFGVQDYGKLLTYFRRYATQTVLCVEGDRDVDDGDSPASIPSRGEQRSRQTPPSTEQRTTPRQRSGRQPNGAAQEQKPRQSDNVYRGGLTEEHVEHVFGALLGLGVPCTVSDVLSHTQWKGAGPAVAEKTVGVALSKLTAQGRIVRLMKGEIPVYQAKPTPEAPDRAPEIVDVVGEPIEEGSADEPIEELRGGAPTREENRSSGKVDEGQQSRIEEIYAMLGYSASRARRDVYERIGVPIEKLDHETAETLLQLLESDPAVKVREGE